MRHAFARLTLELGNAAAGFPWLAGMAWATSATVYVMPTVMGEADHSCAITANRPVHTHDIEWAERAILACQQIIFPSCVK